jgi:hypothetical protein
MNYYLKYLKYKKKYLDLKNLVGGNTEYNLGFDDGYIGNNRYGNDYNYNSKYHEGRIAGKNAKDFKLGWNDYMNNKPNLKKNDEYIRGYEEAGEGKFEY